MQGRRFDRKSQDFGRAPPVNVGDELDVKIEAVGEKGDGVAKKDGFVLFVPNVKENDNVRIKVTRVLRKVGFAEVIGKSEGPVQQEQESEPAEEAEEAFNEENDSDNFGEDDSEDESNQEEASEDFTEEPKEETDSPEEVEEISEDDSSEDFSEDDEDKK